MLSNFYLPIFKYADSFFWLLNSDIEKFKWHWLCVGAFLQCLAMQFGNLPYPHFLLALSLQIIQKWTFHVFSGLLCVSHTGNVCGFPISLVYTGTFEYPNFPKKFPSQLFLTGYQCYIVCLNYTLFLQVAADRSFVFQSFQEMPFQPEWVLSYAKQRTNLHQSLR